MESLPPSAKLEKSESRCPFIKCVEAPLSSLVKLHSQWCEPRFRVKEEFKSVKLPDLCLKKKTANGERSVTGPVVSKRPWLRNGRSYTTGVGRVQQKGVYSVKWPAV